MGPRDWFRDRDDNTRDELTWRAILVFAALIPLALFLYGLFEGLEWILASLIWLFVAVYLGYRHIRHANAEADASRDRPQPPHQ